MESKYKDAVIMNLQAEIADLSQRLSEMAAVVAAARQSNRCDPRFQDLDEGDDHRQKEIESMKSQVGLWGHVDQSVETPQSEWSLGPGGGSWKRASGASQSVRTEGHQGSSFPVWHVPGLGGCSSALSQSSDTPHRETVGVPEMRRSCLDLAQLAGGGGRCRPASALPAFSHTLSQLLSPIPAWPPCLNDCLSHPWPPQPERATDS